MNDGMHKLREAERETEKITINWSTLNCTAHDSVFTSFFSLSFRFRMWNALCTYFNKMVFSPFFSVETYQARTRRSSSFHPQSHEESAESRAAIIDIEMAEKRIREEYGQKACVLETPCVEHAMRPARAGTQPDWNDILR